MEKLEKVGTSVYAMKFLSDWLNENASKKGMNIKCTYIDKENVSIYNKEIDKINDGAVAILRVYQDVEHYCLLTKIDNEFAYLFDPYYLNINYYDKDDEVEIIKDRPFEFNRKVKKERIENENNKDFSLVKGENSEMIIIEKIQKLVKDNRKNERFLNNFLNYTKDEFINAFYNIFGKEKVINSKIIGFKFEIKEIGVIK